MATTAWIGAFHALRVFESHQASGVATGSSSSVVTAASFNDRTSGASIS